MIKQQLKLTIILLFFAVKSFAQLGINGTGATPAASAMLDISSRNKGFLMPRMNSSSRIGIGSPAEGLSVFDTDTKSAWYFNGSSWVNNAPGASLTLPYSATQNQNGALLSLTNLNLNTNSYAIKAVNNGNGEAIYAENSGEGPAGYFLINRSLNESYALQVATYGTGTALYAYGNRQAFLGNNASRTNSTAVLYNLFPAGGPALTLQGGLKVAGNNEQKTAFKITTITGTDGNTTANRLKIPNTYQANDPSDILIVTHDYGPNLTYLNKSFGVYWEPITSSWNIYLEDTTAMPNNITFNVLVIKQ